MAKPITRKPSHTRRRKTTVRQHSRTLPSGRTTTVHKHVRTLSSIPSTQHQQQKQQDQKSDWDSLPIWDKLRIAKEQTPVSQNLLSKYQYKGIDNHTTNTILYDEMLENPRYHEVQKGRRFIVTEMTPDDYMRESYYMFKENEGKSAINSRVTWESATYTDPEVVHKYAEAMKRGEKFPMPTIDYEIHGQEGRHRAMAVKEAFGKDTPIPVMIIRPWDAWESDAKQKYSTA